MEDHAFLQSELDAILQWENEQLDEALLDKLQRMPFKLLDKVTPAFIHRKIEAFLNQLSHFVEEKSEYLINKEKTLQKVNERLQRSLSESEIASIELEKMDETADAFIVHRSDFAAVQGASTGFGGIFTLSIDIPLLLGNALKTLQEIAFCYGFDPHDEFEKKYILNILQFVSSDVVGKKVILEKIVSLDGKQNESLSEVKAWKEVFDAYRDNYGLKKMMQSIPILGVFFGAIFNKGYLDEIAEAGKMFYKKRRILKKIENF